MSAGFGAGGPMATDAGLLTPSAAPGAGGHALAAAGARALGAAGSRALVAVLGAGVLLLPAALAPAPVGWSVVVALVVIIWCLLVAGAGGTARGGAVGFVRRRLGFRAARVVTGLYFAGFATGQAAVALTAGEFAARVSGDAFVWAVAALLAAATWATYRPRPLSTPVRRLRLAVVLATAGGWWALGGAPDATASWWVLLPLLFGWVGIESAVPAGAVPQRTALAGTLLGVTAAAALYAVLLRPPAPLADLPLAPLALLSALVLALYCRTNLQATGARWHELTGRPQAEGTATAATLALVTLTLAHLAGGTTAVLLLLPGSATAAILAVVAVAAVRTLTNRPKEKSHDHDHHRPLEGAARPRR
ncbi:hypothetical protein [Streptomyces justiciae]|uniref:hypothetical protein n=1 Tax=Streptomyces justiciae TaxID=2780140 RepID=UPI00188107E5|nr:hypothetical protein [Streptomyces justiciae]MBE8471369.1 hypothetical protein [Streptomyces justiciae]MCW8377153.1 hypothetical protein [Streptomyces justiciae]